MRSLVVLTSLVALVGCDKLLPKKDKDPADAAVTIQAAASTSAAAPIAPPPVCKVDAQKVWTKGVNALTGLTAVTLQDGTNVVGLSVGNTPHLLTVLAGGNGKLSKVTVDPASAFAKAPKPAEGTRSIWRVTPVKILSAKVRALVDFKDELKTTAPAGKPEFSKTKRVVCGPVDVAENWVAWEGPAYIDEPKHAKDPVTALKGAGLLKPGPPYKEVRDCRSFYDPKHDDEWVVGSEVIIEDVAPKATAKSQLFLESGNNQSRIAIITENMFTDPWKKLDFELPVSHELNNGMYLLAARTSGSLVAQLVTHEKKPAGASARYPGIFQMPDLSSDGADDVFVAAQATANNGLALRAMRISSANPALPKGFSNVTTDQDDSKTEGRPEFLRDAKGQRWMAYIEDATNGKGRLEIIPISPVFAATGKPYAVTGESEKALEARLFAKPTGGFIVVYARDTGDGGAELVTEDLSCEVKQ